MMLSNIVPKEYVNLKKLFLPINSIEKYLLNILINQPNAIIKKRINDIFFNIECVDFLIRQYKASEADNEKLLQENYKKDQDGKRLYNFLLKNLKKRRISEEMFVSGLYNIIQSCVNFMKILKKSFRI